MDVIKLIFSHVTDSRSCHIGIFSWGLNQNVILFSGDLFLSLSNFHYSVLKKPCPNNFSIWKFLPHLFVFLIYFTIFINFMGGLLFKFPTVKPLNQLNLELFFNQNLYKSDKICQKPPEKSTVNLAISWIDKKKFGPFCNLTNFKKKLHFTLKYLFNPHHYSCLF